MSRRNYYRYKIKKTNSYLMIYDRTTSYPLSSNKNKRFQEFKEAVIRWLRETIEAEEITSHLKNIRIRLGESGDFEYRSEEKLISLPANMLFEKYYPSYGGYTRSIILVPYEFNKEVHPVFTHELLHMLHAKLNPRIFERGVKIKKRLEAKYELMLERKKQTFWDTKDFHATLNLLSDGMDKYIAEGFAMFFQEIKHGKVRFSKKELMRKKAAAKAGIGRIKGYLDYMIKKAKVKNYKDLSAELEGVVFQIMEKPEYGIGGHIIHAIVYFQEEEMGRELDKLLHMFVSVFGRARSKKVIKLYEDLMIKNGQIPLIGYRKGAYLNLTLLLKTWKDFIAKCEAAA